jgi:ABC-2 type transport system permease protein
MRVAVTLGSNVGVEALLGVAHRIETVGGYATWNFLCLVTAVGAIWAILLTTKNLRGEEDNGRWELFLAGQTTARRATMNACWGLMAGLVTFFVCMALSASVIAHIHGAHMTMAASLFFAVALTCGAAEFMAVAALASQLMPVRARASELAAAIFGVFYLMRLVADTTSAHWLLDISPLGWIERLAPLYGSDPIWLIPISLFIAVCAGVAIILSGRRDLGSAYISDKDSVKPRTRLLNSPLGVSFRLTRVTSLIWLVVFAATAFIYGLLAKGAVQSFNETAKIQKTLNQLAGTSHVGLTLAFLGITFFFIMILTMFYAVTAIGHIRQDEAEGYLDNFLVRPVGRLQWLVARISLILIVIVLGGLISGIGAWAGEALQAGGVSLHTLLLAGINTTVPAFLIMCTGVFAFGCLPRLTNFLSYGLVAWSFLITMLATGLNINHWLLDTSILHQITFAPATSPNWRTDWIMCVVGLMLFVIGAVVFNRRDIETE